MDTKKAIIDTENAFAHNWGAIALGTFLWSLCAGLFMLIGSMLLGFLLGCLGVSENHAAYMIWTGVVLIELAAIGPFTAGYVKFMLEVIRNKRCHYDLLWSGFRNFSQTFLIGFYIWGIMVGGAILCLLFYMFMMVVFPGGSENIILRYVCVIAASIFLIRLALRIQFVPYFIYEESDRTKSALSSVKECWTQMAGKEGSLFMLLLRFTVLDILAVLTLGIFWCWVYPYTMGSIYFFYRDSLTKYHGDTYKEPRWSVEKAFTIGFIIIFWGCFIGLALS